ncbi:MAG: hypothetical protein IJ874_05680 [Ruminococcus sp.]|nr:hypothetical protein [Ruminococcus sp.]
MKARALRHIGIISAALVCTLGIPYLSTGHLQQVISGSTDAVSGASVAIDQPSGDYIVMINPEKHSDEETLSQWRAFFTGDDTPLIFEDISCTSAANDPAGTEMAESFCSRLPENQMSLRTEDASLMLSKADCGRFDVIIMSAELADAFNAYSAAERAGAEILRIHGAESAGEDIS